MKRFIRTAATVMTAAILLTGLPAVNNVQASSTTFPSSTFYTSLESAEAAWEEYALNLPSEEFNVSFDCNSYIPCNALFDYIDTRYDEMNYANHLTLNQYIIYSGGYSTSFSTAYDFNDTLVSNTVVRRSTQQFQLHGTLTEIRTAVMLAQSIASQWVNESPYEQIMSISRWICNHTEYDNSLRNHSIASCVNDGLTVCEGYAQTFQAMAEYLGLESYIFSGYLDGGGHAWNVVKLDGNWYFVDVTNADQYYFDDAQILFGSDYATSGEFAYWSYETDLTISRSDYDPSSAPSVTPSGSSITPTRRPTTTPTRIPTNTPTVTPLPYIPANSVALDETNFPDASFRSYVADIYDDGDGILTPEELVKVRDLEVYGEGIYDLTGIENFPYLEMLSCEDNHLTELDLSGNPNLVYLYVEGNNLTELDISNCPEIVAVYLNGESETKGNVEWYYGDYYAQLTFDSGVEIITESGVARFIARLYTEVLERTADTDGVNYWVDQIRAGKSGGDVARFFLCSEEFLNKSMTDAEFLEILYAVFFDRAADIGGVNYWLGELNAKGKSQIIGEFINSQEWANVCASYGIASGSSNDPIRAFAERLYTTCLGRDGEEGGIEYWSAELRSGRSHGSDAARVFFFGAEFTNSGISNTEYVKRLYRTFFGREADSAGLNYWLGELSKSSRGDVFNMFTGCQEWLDACSAAGIHP